MSQQKQRLNWDVEPEEEPWTQHRKNDNDNDDSNDTK